MSGSSSLTDFDITAIDFIDNYLTGHQLWSRLLIVVLVVLFAVYIHCFGSKKSVEKSSVVCDWRQTPHISDISNHKTINFDNNNKALIEPKTTAKFVLRRRQMVEVVDHRMDMNYGTNQDGYMEQEEEWEREGLLYAIPLYHVYF